MLKLSCLLVAVVFFKIVAIKIFVKTVLPVVSHGVLIVAINIYIYIKKVMPIGSRGV